MAAASVDFEPVLFWIRKARVIHRRWESSCFSTLSMCNSRLLQVADPSAVDRALHTSRPASTGHFRAVVGVVGNRILILRDLSRFSNSPQSHSPDLEKRAYVQHTRSNRLRQYFHFCSLNYGYGCLCFLITDPIPLTAARRHGGLEMRRHCSLQNHPNQAAFLGHPAISRDSRNPPRFSTHHGSGR